MKRFDRLYKTIFESVKPRPSKRNLNRLLKEDVNDQNTISTTPEQIEIIKKVVNQLASENEDIKDTLEFAPDMDIDYLVLKTDGCYDEWLKEQGYDSDQPDLFGEPEYEEFITETLRDFLTNYDCDEEGLEDKAFSDFYKFKEQLYERDMVAELKNQIPQFKAALKTIKDDDINGYYDSAQVDFSVSDLKWWDKNGLKYSPELAQEIQKYNRWNGWIYEHAFAADDYGDWEYPDALLENLGIGEWFFAMAEAWQNWTGDEKAFDFDKIPVQPELPLESKKVDTKKAIIKEDWDVEKDKYDRYMDNHEKTLIGLLKKNDPSKVSQAIIATCEKKGVKNSKFYKWENAMCTAQFNCLDNVDWWKQNGFTISPEDEKEINWYNWITNKLIEHQRLADDWEGQDWTREILEQGRAGEFLNYVDQLADSDSESLEADRVERATTHQTPMYDDAAEADSLHESKKVNTKKKVIKESKVLKHVKRIKK